MSSRGVIAVSNFELSRSLTPGRLIAWSVLALFPPGILALIRSQQAQLPPDPVMGSVLFVLLTEVGCLLGLLLWATPIVHSELEGRTWIYIAVRPGGRVKLLLGKYLTALVWTYSASVTATSISMLVVQPRQMLKLWIVLLVLNLLSCLAYGALYTVFSVLFHRRAMVFAVAYTMIFEAMVAFIPAMINQITVQFRLRSLLFNWMDYLENPDLKNQLSSFISPAPAIVHISVLLVASAALLSIAVAVIRNREYITAEDV